MNDKKIVIVLFLLLFAFVVYDKMNKDVKNDSNLSFASTLAKDEELSKKIAKAAIAAIMQKKPSIVSYVGSVKEGVYKFSYVRSSDKTKWSYICKFDGDRIIWAAAGTPDSPNEIGRWRNHPLDEIVTYKIESKYVIIKEQYSDGSSNSTRYLLSDL